MNSAETAARDLASAHLAAKVSSYGLGVPVAEVVAHGRGSTQTALARQIAMYLCHVAFELSLARVAVAFGRDRSTVAHACHLVEDRREDPRFDAWLSALENMLREAPAPGLPDEVKRAVTGGRS
jgi:chromosomal replication initiation ATPase DnaA